MSKPGGVSDTDPDSELQPDAPVMTHKGVLEMENEGGVKVKRVDTTVGGVDQWTLEIINDLLAVHGPVGWYPPSSGGLGGPVVGGEAVTYGSRPGSRPGTYNSVDVPLLSSEDMGLVVDELQADDSFGETLSPTLADGGVVGADTSQAAGVGMGPVARINASLSSMPAKELTTLLDHCNEVWMCISLCRIFLLSVSNGVLHELNANRRASPLAHPAN